MSTRLIWYAAVAGAAWAGFESGRMIGETRERSACLHDIARLDALLKKEETGTERLRREVQFLRRLADPVHVPEAVPGLAVRTAAGEADPSLVAKARSALASGEARPFVDTFLAALARGGKGYGELMTLIGELRKNPVPGIVDALLPELDARLRTVLAESPSDGLGIAYMIARIGGPEAVGTLWRASEEQESGVRYHLIGILAGVEGKEGREFLLRQLEDAQDRVARQALLSGLARRPDALEDVAALLAGDPSMEDRMSIAGGLVWSCQENPENRDALWEAARSAPPGVQAAYMSALARAGDGRAQDRIIAELRAGRMSEVPPESWGSFQIDRLRAHRDVFEQTAEDTRLPLQVRLAAAQAVSRVDRVGAVRALTVNFGAQSDSGRMQTVYALRTLGTREAAEELARIAESDSSEAVRNAAQ